MSSEAIGAAKKRVASAELWAGSAAQALELVTSQVSASRQELKDAREFLRGLEEKFKVIEIDSDDSCDGLAGRDDDRADATRATDGKDRSNGRAVTMEIPVKSFIGDSGIRTYTLEVQPSDTIGGIKAKIEDKEGYKSSKLEVFLAPRDKEGCKSSNLEVILRHWGDFEHLLDDDCTVADCGIDGDSVLWVTFSFRT